MGQAINETMETPGAASEDAPAKNVFGGRRWKRAGGAPDGGDAAAAVGRKSVFGGRWKRNAAKSAGELSHLFPLHLTPTAPPSD